MDRNILSIDFHGRTILRINLNSARSHTEKSACLGENSIWILQQGNTQELPSFYFIPPVLLSSYVTNPNLLLKTMYVYHALTFHEGVRRFKAFWMAGRRYTLKLQREPRTVTHDRSRRCLPAKRVYLFLLPVYVHERHQWVDSLAAVKQKRNIFVEEIHTYIFILRFVYYISSVYTYIQNWLFNSFRTRASYLRLCATTKIWYLRAR